MNEKYRQRLRTAADGGDKIAERLLLSAWLAEDDRDEVGALLKRYVDSGDAGGAKYLMSELRCFHGWHDKLSWQELLRRSCDDGCREARFVSSVYHEWASFSGALQSTEEGHYELWGDGWDRWVVPDWRTVLDKDGVKIEQSGPFVPRSLVGFVRTILGPQLRPAEVIDPDSGVATAHPVRINRCAQWLPEQLAWAGKLFECRLAQVADYEISRGEVLNLLHYRPGDRYKPHLDCVSSKLAASLDGQTQGGQRTTTVLLAMGDDDFSGGETYFPRLQTGVRAATGELVRFNNSDSDGKPLQASLHEGRPVKSGEKWLLSKWIRERQTPYGKELQITASNTD